MHVSSSTNTFVCASKLRLRTFETIVHYTAVHVISDLKLTIVSALGLLQCIYELERNLDSCHNATFTDMSVVWKFKTSHFLSHCTNQMLNVPGAGIWLVNRLVSTNERIVSDRRPNLCLASIDRKTRFDVSNSLETSKSTSLAHADSTSWTLHLSMCSRVFTEEKIAIQNAS